jgi:hypothetical protein
MNILQIKKWVVFFAGILAAIIIANWLSNMFVAAAGISGWSRFLVSFILYALLFFAILYGIEQIWGIDFFGLKRDDQ